MALLRVKEAADILRVNPNTLYNAAIRERWKLPVVRIGGSLRFREEDVKRIIDDGLEHLSERVTLCD